MYDVCHVDTLSLSIYCLIYLARSNQLHLNTVGCFVYEFVLCFVYFFFSSTSYRLIPILVNGMKYSEIDIILLKVGLCSLF